MKVKKIWELIASLLFTTALFFFILTFSISLPIYIRPFYYAHIEPLNLSEISGYSESEIKTSYNEVLDYLTLPGEEFSVGSMKYSTEGAAHFSDVKALFNLNLTVLIISAFSLVCLMILRLCGVLSSFKIGKRSAAFYSGVFAIILPLIIGFLASLNFDSAFIVFHKIFFKGKDNWYFDPSTDEIIEVMPIEFFMNSAILIGISVILLSIIIFILEFKGGKNESNR